MTAVKQIGMATYTECYTTNNQNNTLKNMRMYSTENKNR